AISKNLTFLICHTSLGISDSTFERSSLILYSSFVISSAIVSGVTPASVIFASTSCSCSSAFAFCVSATVFACSAFRKFAFACSILDWMLVIIGFLLLIWSCVVLCPLHFLSFLYSYFS